ncbi:hypothetical protein ACS0TY_036619 [Phlomoides rotata]
MPISISVIRSSIAPKFPVFSLKRFPFFNTYSSIASEILLSHLRKDNTRIEKSLNTVTVKLDSRCITQVLERCAIDKPQLGVRFFVWAALHPSHRHTAYLYSKASKLLNLEKNPRIIVDVVDEYRAEGYAVGLKMFKVILNLCRAAQDAELGLWVLRKMKEFDCRPDTVSYNVVIRLLVGKGQLDEAMGLMKEMGFIDLYPDMVTYVSIIKGFCDAGRLEDAFGLIKVMKGHGCVPNAVVYSMLLDGICMHGSFEVALEFLGGMEKESEECKPNVVTYTTMIKGFVKKGMITEALRILDRMNDYGIKPNKVTFVYVFDELCKDGRVEEACKVIDKFRGGVVQYDELYNMLVMSLLRAGKHKESEKMFRTMMTHGVRPNGLTSSCIIRMIVSDRGVLEGFLLLDALEKSGNLIGIDLDVYSSLLAVLCHENHFIEAAEVVNIMVERFLRLKSHDGENITKHLNASGQYDLACLVSSVTD